LKNSLHQGSEIMASENNLGGSVGLDVTAFKAGVMELTNQMKAIENSFRASAAVMGDWSSSTQGLSSRVSSLQDKLALQRKALDTLNSAYQKAVSEQGAGSKSAQSLAKQMFDMQGKIKGTEGQLKKYQSALQTAQKEEKESTSSSAKLGKAFQDFAKKSKESTSNVKSHFSDLKSSILGAVATIGAGLGFKSAIQGVYNLAESASDLVEAQNVVESTFKTSAKSIEAWTDTTAESAGIGKTAATQWSGFMGAMLKSNGITESTASTMSKSLVQLTGDMSSFYNVGTDEMWEKIRSGISGETEPLKQLGINMSEANLQAYAMSQGIDKSYSSMSQSEKTTLRYNYLLSVTKDAQGDFAKTSNDSMANQSRIFQMNIEDMKQTVGAAFLPMINDMYKSLNPLIKEIAPQLAQKAKDVASAIIAHKDDIAQSIKNTVQSVKDFFTFVTQNGPTIKGAILGIGAAFLAWKIASTIGSAVSAIKKFEEAQKAATLGQALLNAVMNANPIGLIVIAIGVLVATFAILWNNCEGFRNFWIGLWGNIQSVAQTAWQGIQSAIMTVWNYIGPTIQSGLQAVQSFWNSVWPQIQSTFTTVWNTMKIVLAPIIAYFDMYIRTTIIALQAVWGVVWGSIKDTFKLIWDLIVGILKTAWGVITGTIRTALDLIKGVFQIFKDLFTGNWSALWNDVKSLFSNIWNDISGIFQGVVNNIGSIFSNLAKDALQWGADIINNIVNGIKNAASAVGDAVKGVAQDIRKFLHFSVPDEGPLADFESWMPDFMEGLAHGIESNKYKVIAAMRSLAADMSIAPNVQPAYVGGYSAPMSMAPTPVNYTFYQYNTSPRALSPAETARQTRNILRQASLQSRR
jgi:phage-related protein